MTLFSKIIVVFLFLGLFIRISINIYVEAEEKKSKHFYLLEGWTALIAGQSEKLSKFFDTFSYVSTQNVTDDSLP